MFCSVYFTPNEPIQDFREKMGGLKNNNLSTEGSKVVARDFNARALEWGMPHTDTRGPVILLMAARAGL